MTMQVEFVSPEDILYSGQGSQVVARTRGGGEIAFLTGHEPFIGSLVPCEVRVTEDGGNVRRFAVRGGFVSVTGTKVTVLSDAAVPAEEIDVAAARAELAEAEAAETADPDNAELRNNRRWAEVLLASAGEAVGSR
ncbi:MAG: ATP synthase F1 subunit epsilon [Acidimicrobiia bacterium]|nr:ATP synthase F1 subunit epsilon [Acidimicrobiia bacterium]